MRRWPWILGIALMASAPGRARSQQAILLESELDGYVRLLEIEGRALGSPLLFRSLSSLRWVTPTRDAGPWSAARLGLAPPSSDSARPSVRVLPVDARLAFNSRYPYGINDGALWAGRGVSAAASGGVSAKWLALSAYVYPTLLFEQNRAFDIVPVVRPTLSPFAYPWFPGDIDWPQRFGDKPRGVIDAGQSGVRLDFRGFSTGLSTENMVWGPAFQNPIMMSANAPGFPHVDLGTGRPVKTPLGSLETRLVWGRLTESQYFDTISSNNHRLFTGFTLALAPKWLPGLTLGLTRVLYQTWDSLRVVDFVDVFQPFFKNQIATRTDPEGEDVRDQLLSLIARWVLPESGFEAYTEWARNDHSRDLRDFLLEPDHSDAVTVGFEKSIPSGSGSVRLRGEWTRLGVTRTVEVRGTPTYYEHTIVRQGYTERGQIIGAGIGPGSDSQHLGFDRFTAGGRWGLFIQRVRYDDDAYYALYGPTRRREGHNVEITGGLSVLRFCKGFDLGASLAVSRELNRHFEIGNDVTNLNLGLTVTWRKEAASGRR